MFTLLWNLSDALCGYLRFYMPTNRARDRLRGPLGSKWAIPVSLIATLSYLFALSVCATIVERGGPAYLNLLVLLFAWNAIKFAAAIVLVPVRCLTLRLSRWRQPGEPLDLRPRPRRSRRGDYRGHVGQLTPSCDGRLRRS